jgi:hypothetical protein
VLGLLAGAFIAFGAMFYTLVMAGADPAYGPNRLLGGVAFSLASLWSWSAARSSSPETTSARSPGRKAG